MLDQHLTGVRELERRLGDDPGDTSATRGVCTTPAAPGRELSAPDRMRAHIDLTVSSLSCDLTRSVTIMAEPGQSSARLDWLSADGVAADEWIDWHEISHGGAPPMRGDSPNKKHLMHNAIQTWHRSSSPIS